MMSEYEVIKKIMDSNAINEYDKVYHIKMFLKGWSTEKDLDWVWEE